MYSVVYSHVFARPKSNLDTPRASQVALAEFKSTWTAREAVPGDVLDAVMSPVLHDAFLSSQSAGAAAGGGLGALEICVQSRKRFCESRLHLFCGRTRQMSSFS